MLCCVMRHVMCQTRKSCHVHASKSCVRPVSKSCHVMSCMYVCVQSYWWSTEGGCTSDAAHSGYPSMCFTRRITSSTMSLCTPRPKYLRGGRGENRQERIGRTDIDRTKQAGHNGTNISMYARIARLKLLLLCIRQDSTTQDSTAQERDGFTLLPAAQRSAVEWSPMLTD
jgi:hypothetical protein